MESDQKEQNLKRRKVVVDSKYGDEIWKILEHAIDEIYNHNGSRLSFEQLYRHAYNMVLHNFGEKLYTGLELNMTCHLKEISKLIEAAQGDLFLEEIDRKWTDHNKALQMICDILMYLDRTYIPTNRKTPVHNLGLNLWRDIIVHSPKIKTRLLDTLLEIILQERTGKVINQGLMRSIIKMLLDLGHSVYMDCFEMPFLDESTHFYKIESQKLIECCDCGDYLKKADERRNEEIKRVRNYLDFSIGHKINYIVEKEMITNYMHRLVHMENSGLVNMLLGDKFEDLRRMYNLFSGIPLGHSMLMAVMASHLKETGKRLVTDAEMMGNPVKFVQCLLNVKDKYDKIINLAFSNDKIFQTVFNTSFDIIIHLNPRSDEFISLFVDYKLRKGLKGVSEEDVEVVLNKIVVLFRYLHDKHVFEKYYKLHLAKRLLSVKKYYNAERSLIVKLKTEFGYQVTLRLEKMLTDMITSQETMQGFRSTHDAELVDSPTLVVQVLTTGSWPIQPSVTCNLPAEMSALCEKFRSYYVGTHAGHRLSWQTNMGTADLKATFGKGQVHELNVSTYQMCVLMMFNNADQYSYKEIEQATEIPPSDLKRCLHSLACAEGKNVLQKDPMTKDISEEDVFSVNDNFTSKRYKIKIGTVVDQKESELEKLERMENHQKPHIEVAIVRIMKSRRVLKHNNIIAEVTKHLQSRFLAYPNVIEKRIESLIEREYLERDGTERNLYRYLA